MEKMTSSSSQGCGRYVKQVDGVGFCLAGKVGRRERARIEAAVEQYIRRNYSLIRAYFAAHQSSGADGVSSEDGGRAASTAVRLCINRANNEVTVVSVNGSDVSAEDAAAAAAASSSGGRRLSCHQRRKSTTAEADKPLMAAAATDQDSSAAITPFTSASGTAAVAAATVVEDEGRGRGGSADSMEAAIEYLVSKDRRSSSGGGGVSQRLLRSSIPSLTMTNNDLGLLAKPLAGLAAAVAGGKQKQSQKQQQQAQTQATDETETSATAASGSRGRLVAECYDCAAHGAAFKKQLPSVRGEFFIFYDHGESHCRKILAAMGFTERRPDEEHNGQRSIDQMAVMWCNGAISAAKRKNGLGYHMVNRLRFRGLMTNKCSLVRTMAEFEVSHPYLVPAGLEASSFLPATIHMNGAEAIDIFHKIRRQGMYLIKPGYSDCGKGIVLYRSNRTLDSLIETLTINYPDYTTKDLVLQKYIENPLLLGGKKFDLRVFLLVVPNQRKEAGVYAFIHPGYARLACRNFDLASDDLMLHLTNQAVQHRDKTYKTVKEDTVWSPDTLNQFLNQHRADLNVPCVDWAKRRLYPRVRAILGHVISVISNSLCDQPMSFELFGCDFLVDDQFNVWLLEVNSDPSLNKSTKVLKQVITQVVEEAVGLAVEVLQLAVRGLPIKALATQQDFRKVFSHTNESVLRCVLAENRIRYPTHLVR